MTAEIAVMNRSAVALAADSAVTVTSTSGEKIYNGAEKLFALSKQHPVGIMVYGSGSLCGVPWELIIKEYRKELDGECFDTLEQYAESFWEFLAANDRLIPTDLRELHLKGFLASIYDTIQKFTEPRVESFISESGGRAPSDEETNAIFIESIQGLKNILAQNDQFTTFDDEALRELNSYIEDFVESEFKGQIEAPFSDEVWSEIKQCFVEAVSRPVALGSNAGIVFAGYGELEFFPTVLAFSLRGYFQDTLRCSPNLGKSAAAGDSGLIAYAQEEVVQTFMCGINPDLHRDINNQHIRVVDETLKDVNAILDEIDELGNDRKQDIRARLTGSANERWQGAISNINKVISEEHTANVQQMIEFLPKDELGYMAESLVNMTAFKRKVSHDSETVGGPIDVAIISKGDGFIWVKRKHYFCRELNEHYFRR
ncbi:hypothetical protein V8094_003651 [Vibrio parahaemolyticus]